MKACPETYKDVRKYFENTIIVCPEVDPKLALYIEQVGSESMKVVDVEKQKGLIDYSEKPYVIQSPLALRREWFQLEDRALLIERIPARMWRKGINSENTCFRTFTNVGEMGGSMGVGLKEVQAYLKNRGMFSDIIKAEGLTATVLDQRWAVHHKTNSVFLLDRPVGKFSVPKNTLLLLKELSHLPLPKAFSEAKVQYV